MTPEMTRRPSPRSSMPIQVSGSSGRVAQMTGTTMRRLQSAGPNLEVRPCGITFGVTQQSELTFSRPGEGLREVFK